MDFSEDDFDMGLQHFNDYKADSKYNLSSSSSYINSQPSKQVFHKDTEEDDNGHYDQLSFAGNKSSSPAKPRLSKEKRAVCRPVNQDLDALANDNSTNAHPKDEKYSLGGDRFRPRMKSKSDPADFNWGDFQDEEKNGDIIPNMEDIPSRGSIHRGSNSSTAATVCRGRRSSTKQELLAPLSEKSPTKRKSSRFISKLSSKVFKKSSTSTNAKTAACLEKLFDWQNNRQFSSTIPLGGLLVPLSPHWGSVRLYIERRKGSSVIMRKVSSVYKLYVGDFAHTKGKPIVFAKRIVNIGSSYYTISTKEEDLKLERSYRSDGYVGKLRGNSACDEYCLYDDGVSITEHEHALNIISSDTIEDVRRCLGCVIYRSKYEATSKVMEVSIPQVRLEDRSHKSVDWPDENLPGADHEPLIDVFRRLRIGEMQNKSKHEKIQCYESLNQVNRHHPLERVQHECSKPSVKNFQLVATDANKRTKERKDLRQEDIVCQFSKVSDSVFSLDVKHPLSIAQAFGICLSRFDTNSIH